MMRSTFTALWIAVALAGQSALPAELHQKFERTLQQIAASVDGVVGYAIVDLTSNDRFVHLENATFPTASTIKLALVHELFVQATAGKIRLDEQVTLDRAHAVGGTGVLVHLGTPTMTIRDYATLMVTLSDNTATNLLIDRLGMSAVNRSLRDLGLTSTLLRRHMMDTEAAKRGEENVSTPADIVQLLVAMQKTQPDAIALLKKPKESRLRAGLPPQIETADKPGELDGVRVDAGIVFAPGRPYAFCVMTTFLKSDADGEHAIAEMSRAAFSYFTRVAAGDLGRRR